MPLRLAAGIVAAGLALLSGCGLTSASPTTHQVDVKVHAARAVLKVDDDGQGGCQITGKVQYNSRARSNGSQSVVIADANGRVLDSRSAPLTGVSVNGGSYDEDCVYDVTFAVPDPGPYIVDAFGFARQAGSGPFTLTIS